MELRSRQVSILKELHASPSGIRMDTLLENLKITKRTFYYDLENINYYLAEKKQGYIVIDENIVMLKTKQPLELIHDLEMNQEYYCSVDERRQLEIFYISTCYEKITLDLLSALFDVSKNTIFSDIRYVKETLKKWNLVLISKAQSGYEIHGEEMVLRRFLRELIQQLTHPGIRYRMKTWLREILSSFSGTDIDFYEICRSIIKQYEIDTKGEFFLGNLDFICLMMQTAWIRSLKGESVEMSIEEEMTLMNTVSFRSLEVSAKKLDLYDINISKQEIFYMTVLFLGIQTTDFVSHEQEDKYIEQFAKDLLCRFEQVSCMNFHDRQRLIKKLNYHIRPLYYRMKYGQETQNPLVHDIKEMYPALYDFTARAFALVDGELGHMISEDEIAYLCIYFASHLNEKKLRTSHSIAQRKLLIVGDDNMATSILVREQLQKLFSNAFQYHITVQSKLKNWALEEYALIVHIGHFQQMMQIPQLVEVEPILSEENKKTLMDMIEQQHLMMEHDELIRKILEVVEQNAEGNLARVQLYFDLLKLFEAHQSFSKEQLFVSTFQDKIKNGDILHFEEKDFNHLISFGCRHLVGDSRSKRLIERMNNIFHNGSKGIYQICKDVALIHCPMQGEVGGCVDESIILCDMPIQGLGHEAKVFIFFSTIDNYSHWQSLEEIYRYFDDPANVYYLYQQAPM